jgi:general secretion pathway protein G
MRSRRTGFSLVELVMVVMIIAVVGAIAIPRLSRGSEGAAKSALRASLHAMNQALDLYAAEHYGAFPSAGGIADQLTKFTDDAGGTSPTFSGTHQFGPYLRTIPPVPIGPRKGKTVIATSDGPTVGWIYDPVNGVIGANGAGAGSVVLIGGGAPGSSGLGGAVQVLSGGSGGGAEEAQ